MVDIDGLTPEDLESMSKGELEELDELLGEGDSKGSGGFPKPFDKDTVFKFFRHIIDMDDSSKIGNIDPKTELGMLKLTVRGYQDIANFAGVEKLDEVSKYCRDKSEIILATSLSKKGFLAQLFVTQIKKEQKIKKPKVEKSFLGLGKKEAGDDE